MKRIDLLRKIFDEKTVSILEELIKTKDIFYLRDISKKTGVSLATTYRITQKLVKLDIVQKEKVGKFIQYKVKKGKKYKQVYELMSGEEIDPLKLLKKDLKEKIGSNFKIFKTQDKKIFLITNESKDTVKILRDIRRKTGTDLNILKISEEQFNSMKNMNLIKEGQYI